ncbi:MAG: protease pro-enzyme activation domain-containing protein [Terriglobales bacterium]
MSRHTMYLTLGSLAMALAVLSMVVSPAGAATAPAITQAVDESNLVTLGGNVRPEVNARFDRGAVADTLPMEHMLLQLKRSPEKESELQAFIEDIHNSSSPRFHHWLTARQFGQRFGLGQADLQNITRWLESHGFAVNVVYENGVLIDFSGTAAQVRETFHTEIHELNVEGEKHIANVRNPQIPAALAPAIAGIVSLNDFRPRPQYKAKAEFTYGGQGGETYAVVPSDLATIYNMNPLFKAGTSGQGQTIVLIEDSDVYSVSDWTTFRSVFGLSSYTSGSLQQVHPAPPSGANNCIDPKTNYDDGEATLDVEYASAAAPSAAIELASCASTSSWGGLIALQNVLNSNSVPPAIVSISYGSCEALSGEGQNKAFNTAYEQAVTEGVSVFVAAGDDGAGVCTSPYYWSVFGIGVNGFASTPYNVAVGGTDFGDTYAGTNTTYWNSTNNSVYGSALSYIPEIPWNDSCAGSLLASAYGYNESYGDQGFCYSASGQPYWSNGAGSGGPSECASGQAAQPGVVGGTCAGYPKPSWQSLVGVPNDTVRDLPDVSLFAANGLWGHYYPYCYTDPSWGGVSCTGTPDTWAGAGGTSFASPIMAGIQALVNQKTGDRQGNPNPVYYSLAAKEYGANGSNACNSTLGNQAASSCTFYDVTLGDNVVDCQTFDCYWPNASESTPTDPTVGVLSTTSDSFEPAYLATAGWDFATGIGSVNAANLVNNWPASSPNFTLAVSPYNVSLKQGASVASTITIVPQGHFNGSVNLTVSGLPSGVTASFNPSSATSTSTLTLNATDAATPGTTTLTVTGTSGNLTASTFVTLTVIQNERFTLSAAPNAVTAPQGATGTAVIAITPVDGFSGNVAFAASGLPKGVTAVFGPNPATNSSTVSFTAAQKAKTGTSRITITGIADVPTGTATASTTITLTVTPLGTFTIAVAPTKLSIERGSSGTATITIASKNGFDQNVDLLAKGLPKGVTASFSQNPAGSTSTLTLTASPSAKTGTSNIAITGIFGTLSKEVFLALTVSK